MELPIKYSKTHFSVRKLVREEYVRLQKNKCCHCGTLLTKEPSKKILDKPINLSLFPKGMFNYPVHLHHCHKTDLTIGAIHARCNAYLWQYHNK